MSLLIDAILGNKPNLYGDPSTGVWNLARGIFTTQVTNQQIVLFFEKPDKDEPRTNRTGLEQVSDTGGRRLVVYEYAYQDGQKLADLGRKGETFVWSLKFFGLNYQQRLDDFIRIVQNSGEAGVLVHPVRGSLSVRLSDWEYVHRHDEWNAVTIKATFKEDNSYQIAQENRTPNSPNTGLRSSLQSTTNYYNDILVGIAAIGNIAATPSSVVANLTGQITTITAKITQLLGQLAATFSTDAGLKQLSAQSSTVTGGFTGINTGVPTGSAPSAALPPVYQVGFDPTTQVIINTQTNNFVSANQISPQQAVFTANQLRQSITAAINSINDAFGNNGYDLVVQYRGLANAVQDAVQASIAMTQALIKQYTVPVPMSLRTVAFNNGLSYDRQNDIEALNPYLPSVNYVPAGTVLSIPAS